MPDGVDGPPCPRCGQPVSTVVGSLEAGDQFAVDRRKCPKCGASLVRDVDGHADRGWRLDEEPGG
ncbi:MAG: hypothetical protein WBP81_27455 [Solirubrobacteraceae bacterium]